MRSLALAAAILAAAPVLAQTRPNSTEMPCARAAALVAAQGAVVLGTGAITYDRFVSGANQCVIGEYADPAWVPARDNPQCFVGYRCRSRASIR